MQDSTAVIPFGPHNTAFFETIQINLRLDDESVQQADFVTGYSTRHVETIIEAIDYKQALLVVERICGICSFFHSVAYCSAIERIKGIEVPVRGKFLRIIWCELQRIQNHYLWLSLTADAIGFESVSALMLQAREHIMDILMLTAGGRVILPVNTIGGVKKDISDEVLAVIMIQIKNLQKTCGLMQTIFYNDYIIKKRLQGVGVLSPMAAKELGAVGPAARAAGIKTDMRQYDDLYNKLGFECVGDTAGDAYSRIIVRIKEIEQSIEIIKNAISNIPCGETGIAVKGMITGETTFCLEQPEGKLEYYVAGKNRSIKEIKICTASDSNFKALHYILQGSKFCDVPLIFMSMGMCVACLDK